jgi:putative heme iron utilization protein
MTISDDAGPDDADLEASLLARRLARAQPSAALASVAPDGQPHASLVLSCCDLAARPVLLISRLAVHTQNLAAEPRAALLYEDCRSLESPLTGPRLTLSGRLRRTADDDLRARYLRRHPDAQIYADFDDFEFYRLDVGSAHLIAGFGRIETIAAEDFIFDAACNAELAAREAEIIDHMNADHADAVDLLAAQAAMSNPGDGGWTLTGVDAEGLDLRRGGELARINFERALTTAAEVRSKIVALVDWARNRSG